MPYRYLLESGDLKALHLLLDKAVQQGISEKYAAVQEARTAAAKEGTVEVHRERVEAELLFEKYVDELYKAATGDTVHHEGE